MIKTTSLLKVYTWQEEEQKTLKAKKWVRLLKISLVFIGALVLLWLSTSLACANQLKASYYSQASLIKEGTRKQNEPQIMANGKAFNENALTCATRLYPLGTRLKVTNINNKKSVIVIVTDRIGKRFANSRIDLSKRAFSEISPLKQGIVPIKAERI